jgi:exosortase
MNTTSAQEQTPLTWLPLAAIGAIFLLLYWPAINEFVYDWSNDDNYSHGFLIPAVSGYLLWQKRACLKEIRLTTDNRGLVLLIIGLLLAILGTAAAEWFTLRFSMIVVLLGLTLYLGGRECLRVTWFPIVFIIFAIPWPYTLFRTLTFPMQLFSTQVTHVLISGMGITSLRQGNIIYMPNYALEVVEACSGLRSLITLSALAAVFAYLTEGGILKRGLIFLTAFPVAITANIIRLLITALGAVVIGPEFAEGFIHSASGLVVFMVGLAIFVILTRTITWVGNRNLSS